MGVWGEGGVSVRQAVWGEGGTMWGFTGEGATGVMCYITMGSERGRVGPCGGLGGGWGHVRGGWGGGLGEGGTMWGFGGRVGSCVGLGEGGAMWGFEGRVGPCGGLRGGWGHVCVWGGGGEGRGHRGGDTWPLGRDLLKVTPVEMCGARGRPQPGECSRCVVLRQRTGVVRKVCGCNPPGRLSNSAVTWGMPGVGGGGGGGPVLTATYGTAPSSPRPTQPRARP